MAYKPKFVKKRAFKKRPYKKRAVKRNTNLVKTIKTVMRRQVETKILQFSSTLNVRCIRASTTQAFLNDSSAYLTPWGAVNGSLLCPYPVLANGIGQDQRIGDEVKIKGSYINFLLTAAPYNATYNANPRSHMVTIWAIRPKIRSFLGLDVTQIQSGTSANFFENQSNTDSGLVGTLVDLIRKEDPDNYQVLYKRTFKLGYSSSLGNTNLPTSFPNNDFNSFITGRFKIKPYTWKVDRNENPQMQSVYLFATAIPADGSTDPADNVLGSITFNEKIYYTDA